MIVNKYNYGGGGSSSAVTPEEVQQQIDSALTPYWDSAITESAITEAVSGKADSKILVDFDKTSQAERAALYTTLKALYDGGSGATINKDYDFFKTVGTKQGLKIDYYTFSGDTLVFGKVVSPDNTTDQVVYGQVLTIDSAGNVNVVTNTVGGVDLTNYWNSAVTEQHIESAASITYASAASYTDQAVAGIDLSAYDTAAVASTKYSKVTTSPVSGNDVDLGFLYIETSGVSKQLNIAKINGKAVIGLNQEYRYEFEFPTSAQVQTQIDAALSGFTPAGDSTVLKAVTDFPEDPEMGDMVSRLAQLRTFSWNTSDGVTAKMHLNTYPKVPDQNYDVITFTAADGDALVVLGYWEEEEYPWQVQIYVDGDMVESWDIYWTGETYSIELEDGHYASIGFIADDYSGLGGGMLQIGYTDGTFGNWDGGLNNIPDLVLDDVYVEGVPVEYAAYGTYIFDGDDWKKAGTNILAAITTRAEYGAISGSVKTGDLIQVFGVDINGDGEAVDGLFMANVDGQGSITWNRKDNIDSVEYSNKYYPWMDDNGVLPIEIGEIAFLISNDGAAADGSYNGIGFDGDGKPVFTHIVPEYDDQTGEITGMTREDRDILGELDTLDEVVSAALVDLDEKKVESEDIHNIVRIEQSDYDTLVAQSETTSTTLYVVIPDQE